MDERSDHEMLLEEARHKQRFAAWAYQSSRRPSPFVSSASVEQCYAEARALYRAAVTARKLAEGHVLVAPNAERFWSAVGVRGYDEWFTDGSRRDAEEEAFTDWDNQGRPDDDTPQVNEYALVATHEVDVDG